MFRVSDFRCLLGGSWYNLTISVFITEFRNHIGALKGLISGLYVQLDVLISTMNLQVGRKGVVLRVSASDVLGAKG